MRNITLDVKESRVENNKKIINFADGQELSLEIKLISRDDAFKSILNHALETNTEFNLTNRVRNYELERKLETIFNTPFAVSGYCPINGKYTLSQDLIN